MGNTESGVCGSGCIVDDVYFHTMFREQVFTKRIEFLSALFPDALLPGRLYLESIIYRGFRIEAKMNRPIIKYM